MSEKTDILKYGVTEEVHEASEERCGKCFYRGYGESFCDYIAITGKPRILVSPGVGEDCTAFRPRSGMVVRKAAAMTIPPNAGERWEDTESRRRQMVYRQMRVMYDEGKNDHEIAEELGISANTVRNWRHREGLQSVTGRHNTTEEAIMERRRQMLRLWKEGKNDREIAEAVGVTKKTVQTWRHRAGMASNYERGKSHANE